MQHITILALPSSLASSISLPLEILNAASESARSRNRRHPPLTIEIASQTPGPVKTAGGMTIIATTSINSITQTDLVILPSLWRDPLKTLRQHQEIIPWLQTMAAQNALLCAVGTSSCFLAEAGLLDNKPATSHWSYLDQFARRYPKVRLKPRYLITEADNIYCAGSINSVADLMIHLIGQFYGQAIARQVEAQFSPEIRRPFEDHAFSQSDSGLHHDEIIIEAQEWLRLHYNEPINLNRLATTLQLSMRSFNRRFKQATGATASDYLQKQRMTNAKELLRTSNLSISEVAAQSGYQDSSYFCERFKKAMGQSPLAYRTSVRGKLFKVI
jgi:transcriptional regulator GlxA family with amidase domain